MLTPLRSQSTSNAKSRENVVDRVFKRNGFESPLLAQMRSADRVQRFLLLGVDRTCLGHHETDANDPNRTFASFAGLGYTAIGESATGAVCDSARSSAGPGSNCARS